MIQILLAACLDRAYYFECPALARTHVRWEGFEAVFLGQILIDQKLSNIQILSFNRGKKINQKLKIKKGSQ